MAKKAIRAPANVSIAFSFIFGFGLVNNPDGHAHVTASRPIGSGKFIPWHFQFLQFISDGFVKARAAGIAGRKR
jgi:hypothetical protein